MNNLPEDTNNEVKLELSEQGYVTLPFNKEEFKEFVIGLLGKPQVIQGKIEDAFEIDKNSIRNIFELVNQRITQQNDGLLVQFSARIVFSDNTSVLVNSIDELMTYNVIKPVITEAIHITFQYLIKFQDKNVPEKQEINISFVSSNKKNIEKIHRSFDYLIIRRAIPLSLLGDYKAGFIEYNIKHTARTWGTDIESILVNHFQSLLLIETPLKKFLRKYDSTITAFLFFTVVGLGIFLTRNIHYKTVFDREKEIEAMFKNIPHSLNDISNELKFLASNGYFDSSTIYVIGIMASLFLGIIAAAISSSMISEAPKSYVLLSSEAYKNKQVKEKAYDKQFRNFIWSVLISLICGVLGNFIFLYLTKS